MEVPYLKNKKIIRVIQRDRSLMNLTWMTNNICNNRCSYCTPSLHSGIGHHYKWDNAKKFLEKLFDRYPKIHCSVVGGEPSLSDFFPELVKTFNSSGHTIGVTSNAFNSIEYWEDVSKYLYYICFSYHSEFPAKDFREKVIAASLNTSVTVRVMMLPSKWDHCIDVFNSLKDIDTCLLEPVRIFDWGGKNREASVYTEDQLNWFKSDEALRPHQKMISHLDNKFKRVNLQSRFEFDDKSTVTDKQVNPLEFINSGMTNFKGYTCEVGLKSLHIDSTGSIFLGNCMIGGPIGNINDFENIKWTSFPVICHKEVCHCATDVIINKWIENYEDF